MKLISLIRSSTIYTYRSQEISSAAEAEAKSSAKQLVALQQRLASLKDAVAAAQRVAAAREAAAAAAIQRNAAATAAELQKQDVDKQISQSEQEAKVTNRQLVYTSLNGGSWCTELLLIYRRKI